MSAAEGTLAFWKISQKYYSLPTPADQEIFLLSVVEPMIKHMKNHVQIELTAKFLERVRNDNQPIRAPLGTG